MSNEFVITGNRSLVGNNKRSTNYTTQNSVTNFITENKQIYDESFDVSYDDLTVEDKSKITTDFLVDKGTNATTWAATKDWVAKEFITYVGGAAFASSVEGTLLIALLEGSYKNVLADASGKGASTGTFISGFAKSISSNLIKEEIKQTSLKSFLSTTTIVDLGKKVQTSGLLGKGKFEKMVESIGMKSVLKKFPNLREDLFKGTVGNLGVSIGVDYFASIIANAGKLITEGKEVNLESLKAGSTLLKSSTKMICATVGQLIGSVGGKVGAEAGKKIGTVVGATIGEFQTLAFTENDVANERWCAIAGGTQIVGAVAGVAVVAFCFSNPVGWVVGVGILVGAVIGFAVTYIAYSVDSIRNAIDGAIESVGTAIDNATEWIKVQTQANPVTDFLIGWAF